MTLETIKPNLTEVTTNGKIVVYSYSTPVIIRINGKWHVTSTRHSNTTSRHITHYLTKVYAMSLGDWTSVPQSTIDSLAA